MIETIAGDERRVVPVSTLVNGMHGIDEQVSLSLPCVMGRHGIVKVLEQPLSSEEKEKLQKSAKGLWSVQKDLDLP